MPKRHAAKKRVSNKPAKNPRSISDILGPVKTDEVYDGETAQPEEIIGRMEASKPEREVEMVEPIPASPETPGTTVNDGHEHRWVKGMLPGNQEIRICTYPGCGLTEKVQRQLLN